MGVKKVPPKEIRQLISLMIQNFHQQYGRKINQSDMLGKFIIARTDTRIGFEAYTKLPGGLLKLRLYARFFILGPFINPYKLEEIQDEPLGPGDEVYVTITDLPLDLFPILSQTLNPQAGDEAGPYAIELEDGSGWIEAENGEYLVAENQYTQ